MISIIQHFKCMLTTVQFSAMVIESDYRMMILVEYIQQLTLCYFNLKQNLYIAFHFSQLQIVPSRVYSV